MLGQETRNKHNFTFAEATERAAHIARTEQIKGKKDAPSLRSRGGVKICGFLVVNVGLPLISVTILQMCSVVRLGKVGWNGRERRAKVWGCAPCWRAKASGLLLGRLLLPKTCR